MPDAKPAFGPGPHFEFGSISIGAPEALPAPVRTRMESALAADFSDVRVVPESSRAARLGARAFTRGNEIHVAPGLFAPQSSSGQVLLGHELTHVAQQRAGRVAETGRTAGVALNDEPALEREARTLGARATRLGGGDDGLASRRPRAPGGFAGGAVVQLDGPSKYQPDPLQSGNPSAIADAAIGWMNYYDRDAPGGVGDFPKAFGLLAPLDTKTLLSVLAKLDERNMLEVLYGGRGSAPAADQDRVSMAMMVLLSRAGKQVDRGTGPAIFRRLGAADQATLKAAAASIPAHWQTILFEGEGAEVDRLVGRQEQFLEDKRKAQEEAARKQQEADAKAKGAPAPSPESAPKVGIGDVIAKEVSTRELKPAATKEWDDLSEKDKNEVWPNRAKVAFAKVRESIKRTELEGVMKGHDFVFEPRKMFTRGSAYAYEDQGNLVTGMGFVKDAEKDPKNVWPIVAHEIGGHAAYGTTYASKVMSKFLDRLPESERSKWTRDKAVGFYDAFEYAETEIFSALRQRKYDVPESGPAPVHGAIKPDDNIERRLTAIDQAFPKDVGTAILQELNERVQADGKILPRDKKVFLEQVKNHGYTL